MRGVSLSHRLIGRLQPRGYVSFLSALVHHGALLDGLTRVQVASPDRWGCDDSVHPGPVDYLFIPRDLYFGWETTLFEGDLLPVASPEKALLDWLYWCEEQGQEARLEELEWESFSVERLDELVTRTGIRYRPLLARSEASLAASHHDQEHRRQQALARLAHEKPAA